MWKRNGKKGNDEFDNEQTLLRFFAGCEILEFDNKKIADEKVEVPKKEPEKKIHQ